MKPREVCSVEGCTTEKRARGMCLVHYSRERRRIAALGRPTIEDRFWARVDRDGPVPSFRPDLGPCWLWTGRKDRNGYGALVVNRVRTGAHRRSYMLAVGPIPEKYDVDHLCRVHACVNPAHLEAVTHRENNLRGLRGRLRTHCPQGHPLVDGNLYFKGPTRQRLCRQCVLDRSRLRNRGPRPKKIADERIPEVLAMAATRPQRQVAAHFSVSQSEISRIVRRHRATAA